MQAYAFVCHTRYSLRSLPDACLAAQPSPSPVIDLGWLKASQTREVAGSDLIASLILWENIKVGDVIVKVDDQRVDTLNALSAALILGHIVLGAEVGAETVTVLKRPNDAKIEPVSSGGAPG